MSVAEKMKTLELLSIDRKQFNELITEHKETINSIIAKKKIKIPKEKYIASYYSWLGKCSSIHVAYNSL